jgi:Bacterial Ig-like domain (group 3)
MKGLKLKSMSTRRFARTVLMLGVAGATAGAALVVAASGAQAAVGDDPGNLVLSPSSGPTSTAVTWGTNDACPSGFQGSAILMAVTYGTTTVNTISAAVQAGPNPIAAGQVLSVNNPTVADVQSLTGTPNGGTDEWVVQCASGNSGVLGNLKEAQDIFVTFSANGSSYTTSSTGPSQIGSTTTLAASLSGSPITTGQSGQTITLTATVTDSDSSTPVGSVEFEQNGTEIGTASVTVASGVATTTVTLSGTSTIAFSAVYTPTNQVAYAGSTGTLSLPVEASGSQTAIGSPETITVSVAATGSLTVSIPSNPAVPLTVSGSTATGNINTVDVSDTRNTYPGWSVSGQETTAFTASGTTFSIPADNLGWVPGPATPSPLPTGVTLGPAITAGTTSGGLGDTGGVLASATPGAGGFGSFTFGAGLTLDIPAAAPPGNYGGSLTITYLEAGP